MFSHHFRIYLAKTRLLIFTFYIFFSQHCTQLIILWSGQFLALHFSQLLAGEWMWDILPQTSWGLPCPPWLQSHVLPPSHALCASVKACQAVQRVMLLQDKPDVSGRFWFQLGCFSEEPHCEVSWAVESVPGEKTVWTSARLRCYRRVPKLMTFFYVIYAKCSLYCSPHSFCYCKIIIPGLH